MDDACGRVRYRDELYISTSPNIRESVTQNTTEVDPSDNKIPSIAILAVALGFTLPMGVRWLVDSALLRLDFLPIDRKSVV